MVHFYNDNAILECRRTPWDDRVFGFPCAEITHFQAQHTGAGIDVFSQFDTWAQTEDMQFAYGRFEPTRLVKQVVHKAGFYFAEASYQAHHYKLQSSDHLDRLIRPGPVLELSTKADHQTLRVILANDFEHGRIHEDPFVEANLASLRYQNWLTDLLAQQDEVYSYRLKGELIGLHIQRCEGDKVHMILTGVKRSHALLGVSLWAEVMHINRLRGMRQAHTLISAANIPIVNLYRRFEFQFDKMLLGFHRRWPN
jgi:hypothetical protein